MIDVAASAVVFSALIVLAFAYIAWSYKHGPARFARVDKDGGSALLGKGAMQMGYWTFSPVGAALARAGVTAAQVTWTSLALGLVAAAAAATHHFGVAALLACVSVLGDMLDGMVARETNTASEAGEILDVAVDRYVESAFLVGVAIALRGNELALVLSLGALVGGWAVTYTSAKAESLGVAVPRGAMRRPERAVYLVAGAAFSPFFATAWPMVVALAIVAVLANVSAIVRFVAIAKNATARAAARNPAKITYGPIADSSRFVDRANASRRA